MSLRVMYAHLGLLEPGTAAIDRDGDVWCFWPDGMSGNGGPALTLDMVEASRIYGPFDVLAAGLTQEQCDEIAAAESREAARALALRFAGKPPEIGPLDPELGTESIDGPNGLRHHVGRDSVADALAEATAKLNTVREAVIARVQQGQRERVHEILVALPQFPAEVVRSTIEHLTQRGIIHFDVDMRLAPGSGWQQ